MVRADVMTLMRALLRIRGKYMYTGSPFIHVSTAYILLAREVRYLSTAGSRHRIFFSPGRGRQGLQVQQKAHLHKPCTN